MEEELAKAAAGKKPDDKLLTRAEWATIKQLSAEKGWHARELAQLEYEGTAMKSGLSTSQKSFLIIKPGYQVQHGGHN